jgi:hypothetical protein
MAQKIFVALSEALESDEGSHDCDVHLDRASAR